MKYINQANEKFINLFKPIWDKIIQFFNKEYYVIYAIIVLFLIVLIIPGLFTFLKRWPKFFAFIIILLSAIVLVWYFLILK